ncbi:acyltransferase [Streptomyces atacamensis]|uniref:acyltransferase n=1 Tax=Streptomyces atacamensis TaxID=531966 RepID=UPI00399CCC17
MSNETAVQTPERGPDAGAGSGQSDLARNAPLHGVPAPAAHPSSSAPAPAPVSAPAPASAPREHRHDIDLMRLICSVAVMLGHIGGVFIAAVERQEANGPGAYWTGHIVEALNPFAVPMYFAIAGWAVLAGAPPRDSRRMWQRIVRNSVPLFVWTALYLLWGRAWGTNDGPVSRLALEAVFGSVRPAYHLWFMYAYIPLIAALAFVVLVRAGKRPWGLGAVLLVLASAPSLMGDLERWTGWDLPRFGWGFGVYQVAYALGGAMLFALPAGALGRLAGRRWVWAVPMALTAAGVLWYHTRVHYVIPNAHLLVAVMTGCVLLMVTRVRVPERWVPLLSKLAGASLGAYMVHVMVISAIVEPLVSADVPGAVAGPLFVALLAATVAVSFGASLLWGRLGLRRYLG